MSYPIIDKAPRHLWTQLIALLPACAGCSAVLDAATVEFCVECMERSRDSPEEELGGES